MGNEEKGFSNRKLEEELEIKSLRRIISAYLNYADAAEEDVKRYERSFKKLSPAHEALLSHLPTKYTNLRRCISINSFFIVNMLQQAFEPPLDMSQDMDVCEHHLEDASSELLFSGERNSCPCHPTSTSGTACLLESDQAIFGEGNNQQEVQIESFCNSIREDHLVGPETSRRLGEIESCDDDEIVNNPTTLYSGADSKGNVAPSRHNWLDPSHQLNVPSVDVDKVRCIIRNIVRDWAPEGQKERDQCYKPILDELDRLFPDRSKERPPCCLVPGAGLGRLALDISCLGFVSEGNEFSYYMMICSSFILNHAKTIGEWTIYPWIHSNNNSFSDYDQLRPVSVPDILPASAGITEGFSMCGGDFVEVYSDPSQEGYWDVIVTCFFIDTAHNVVEYIEIISKALKDGGVWINLGPLLYHFADAYGEENEMSIELSLEDVKRVAFHYGFQLEREELIATTYAMNPLSMMQIRYNAAFWTMRKMALKNDENGIQ